MNKRFAATIKKIIAKHDNLEEFEKALANDETYHLKIENAPYMPLTIEAIGNHHESGLPQVSVCHYGEQNGDLMRDPEIVFEILPNDRGWMMTLYRNDYMNFDRSMVAKRNKDGFPVRYRVDNFPTLWNSNLRHQRFC